MENKELNELENGLNSQPIESNEEQANSDHTTENAVETSSEEQVVAEEDNNVPEEPTSTTTETTATETELTEESVVVDLSEFEDLVTKANAIADSHDWQNGGHNIKELKAQWAELTIPDGSLDQVKELEKQLSTAEEAFFQRRTAHYAEMDRKRKENYETKKSLLDKIEKLIERKKWMAQGELRAIQNKWEQVRHVPQEFVEELNTKYNSLLEAFEASRVDFLVKKKEQEELNLEGKLYVIDRIKKLVSGISEATNDWNNLDFQFEELMKDWKKVGRVTAEKADEIWNEFKNLKDEFYSKKLSTNDEYRKELEANEKKKRALIDKAVALKNSDDLAESAREINKLHKDWKEIGNVAPDKADELWNEFKTASDAFNEYKNEHLDEIKDQEKTNYDLKIKLCEKAEQLADHEDWKFANQQFQKLLDEWKQIGPVPRRKTKKIWQRFKKAMDNFYARKRQQLKEIRSDEKDNLQKKRDLIDKVKGLHEQEDAVAALAEVKELQAQFNAVGFVPIKMKDKIYKQFKEACDVIYKRSREQQKGHFSGEGADAKKDAYNKSQKISKLKKQADKLNETILNYSDTKTFIKPNKKGLALRDEIDAKIAQLKSELQAINAEIESTKVELESGNND
ncbi:DUF349 domain-containing protein [bacterium]|nr:MAG: DUF349 domain-containing protein [bacterium]